jgi:sugar phosphate isomerase/epimerase
MLTRRQFGRLAAAALVARGRTLAGAESVLAGVRVGVQTFSFRALDRRGDGDGDLADVIVKAVADAGLGQCELFAPQAEPRFGPPAPLGGTAPADQQPALARGREALRQWRLSVSLEHFRAIRRKFEAAGVGVYAYNLSINDSFTDAEIDRAFEMAQALGAAVLSSSSTLSVTRRVAPFADRHGMTFAVHNGVRVDDPNAAGSAASLDAITAISPRVRLNFDIGHYTAANLDPAAFLRERLDRVTHLHVKDRRRNNGEHVAWETGDTPIREVLRLLQARRSPAVAMIEYEYPGTRTPVEEVRACYEYMRKALA